MPKTVATKLMTTDEMMAVMDRAKARIESDERKIALLREQLQDVIGWFDEWSIEIGPAEQVLFDRIEIVLKATE